VADHERDQGENVGGNRLGFRFDLPDGRTRQTPVKCRREKYFAFSEM
jgi:hypothetical protein